MIFIRFILAFLFLVLPSGRVQAQNCDTVYEQITKLRPPSLGQYTVWDTLYGEDGMEQFADFLPMDDGGVLAAGSYTKDEEDQVYKPLLVRLDGRGRVVWEVREESTTHKTIDKIVGLPKGYVVLGDIKDPKKGDGIYVARYTQDGQRKSQKTIFKTGADLDAVGIVRSADQKGVIVAVQLHPRGKEGDKAEEKTRDGRYGLVYRLTESGKIVWHRAYTPGMDTAFHGLKALGGGLYMLTGQIRLEDGRLAGWLVRVNENGAMDWQQTYPRGQESSLQAFGLYHDGHMIVGGHAKPLGRGHEAAFIARLDAAGQAVWQRYYTGPFHYAVSDILTYPDGRIVALTDGSAMDFQHTSHARLLTFSPRGYLMDMEDYSHSYGARGLRLLRNDETGDRVLTGYARTRIVDAETPADVPPNAFDAWVTAAVPLDPYEDPCTVQDYLP